MHFSKIQIKITTSKIVYDKIHTNVLTSGMQMVEINALIMYSAFSLKVQMKITLLK